MDNEAKVKLCVKQLQEYIEEMYHTNGKELTEDKILEMWDRIDIVGESLGIKSKPHD